MHFCLSSYKRSKVQFDFHVQAQEIVIKGKVLGKELIEIIRLNCVKFSFQVTFEPILFSSNSLFNVLGTLKPCS